MPLAIQEIPADLWKSLMAWIWIGTDGLVMWTVGLLEVSAVYRARSHSQGLGVKSEKPGQEHLARLGELTWIPKLSLGSARESDSRFKIQDSTEREQNQRFNIQD
jgi:hypothetical protein